MTALAPPFRAALRRRHVRSVWLRAFERFRASRPKGSVALSHSYERADGSEAPPDVTEQTARLWVASPTRWRYEVDMPGGVAANVVDGERMWSYVPGVDAWSNEGDTVRAPAPTHHPEEMSFRPAGLLSDVSVTSRRREGRGGDVEIIDAVPLVGRDAPFAPGADAYEIVVDPARDVVLRYAARLDGVEYFSVEIESLEHGIAFADALFRIELPDGVRFGPPPLPRRDRRRERLRRALHIRR